MSFFSVSCCSPSCIAVISSEMIGVNNELCPPSIFVWEIVFTAGLNHEENIMFFNKRKREESPSELVEVTPNLLVKVWQATSRRGQLRVHFGFRRVASDGGDPFLSLTPETLLEMPLAISKVAKAFSQVDGLDEAVRIECAQLAVLMEKVSQHQSANGPVEEKKPEPGRILNLV